MKLTTQEVIYEFNKDSQLLENSSDNTPKQKEKGLERIIITKDKFSFFEEMFFFEYLSF